MTQRVVQPRLRHRFQVDRHGLALSTHRLLGDGEEISFDFHTTGTGVAQVLGAIYAVERLDVSIRHLIAPVLHKAMRWRGAVGGRADRPPRRNELDDADHARRPAGLGARRARLPARHARRRRVREVTAQFRVKMRSVHPDHGGDHSVASTAVFELAEARKILIAAADKLVSDEP